MKTLTKYWNLINLRNFWDSNSGIHKNVEPDPLTLVSYKKKSVSQQRLWFARMGKKDPKLS